MTQQLQRKQRVLVIDGTNNLIRAISVAQSRPSLNAKAVFFRILSSTIQKFRPNECYLVFDGEGGNDIKRKVFSEYKANRKAVSKIQTQDYLQLYKILKHTPIITIKINNIEGDNVIAHIALTEANKGSDVVICSSDRDFYQLANGCVTVWNPISKVSITRKQVVQKYQCLPENFGIFKSIVGDSSDNIPGVRGVGQKTIHRYLPNVFIEHEPLEGSIVNFQKYVNQMQHSDHKLKLLEEMQNIKNYFKIVDLRSGAFLTPQVGSIIQDIVEKKRKHLTFDKEEFLTEARKFNITNQDLVIIYPALHMIQRKTI